MSAYRMQKQCDAEGVFVVEGEKLCREALDSGFGIRVICGTEEWFATQNNATLDLAAEIYLLTPEQLERLSNLRTPNKVWMIVERKETWDSTGDSSLTLALDGLQDPGNMGTILRIADWYGIRRVVCGEGTVSCYNPKVVQSSMGAIFRTEIIRCDLPVWLSSSKERGTTVYGAHLDGTNIYKTSLQKPAVLVIGNEGKGISAEVSAMVDSRITIPNIGGTCESLNAAIATAIICSEFYR